MSNVSYEIKQHFEQDKFVVIEGVEKYDKDGHSVAVPYMAVFAFREGQNLGDAGLFRPWNGGTTTRTPRIINLRYL